MPRRRRARRTAHRAAEREHAERRRARELERAVGGPVIAHDHLEVGVVAPLERGEATTDQRLLVAGAHDDGDRRPVPAQIAHAGTRPPADDVERGLRPPLRVGQPEAPSVHGLAGDRPLVRPGEDGRPRAAGVLDRAQLPRERVRLLRFAVHAGREPELGDEQRQRTGDDLQVAEVALERFGVLEEDVETRHVLVVDVEVLGRRVVHVRREQAAGAHLPAQLGQDTRDGASAAQRSSAASTAPSPASRIRRRARRPGDDSTRQSS